jgi:tRNA-specific 2-thiouridylase
MQIKMEKKILVGMSGGVDSAVTVHLLKCQGYKVTGIFLEMLEVSDFKMAKKLAKQLDIELIRENIKDIFEIEVIKKFVDAYKNGLTPNPCVGCNPEIKFKYLLRIADKRGINKIATGHYAQVDKGILKKAIDTIKDQSYFLYRLKNKQLQRIVFPLGKLEKTEVKQIAEGIKLDIPSSESQDVCFLKKFENLEEYLQKKVSMEEFAKGNIVDEKGMVIGQHRGLLIYTMGQRKGLNIGGSGPFYVVGKDFKKNELLVSRNKKDEKLLKNEILISNVNWIKDIPMVGKQYQVKIRYQMKSVEAIIEKRGDDWIVKCAKDIWAATAGQSLVVYDGNVVVGGGIIGG